MNFQKDEHQVRASACGSRITSGKVFKILGLAAVMAAATLWMGCESVKQYSIESYQGPMPISDLHYVETQR